MFFDLLLAPITAPFNGFLWITEQIQERVEAELDNQENLSKRLLALQVAVDMGEISEEEFEAQEEALLMALQAIADREKAEAEQQAELDQE